MAEKKYLDLTGLEHYDNKIKAIIPSIYMWVWDGNESGVLGKGEFNSILNADDISISDGSTIFKSSYISKTDTDVVVRCLLISEQIFTVDIIFSNSGVWSATILPNVVSQLENDKGYITREDIPSSFIHTITTGKDIDETTGEIIDYAGDQYDRQYYLTNEFHVAGKFITNYKFYNAEIDSEAVLYIYDFDHNYLDKYEAPIVADNYWNQITFTPTEGEYYYRWLVKSWSYGGIYIEPGTDESGTDESITTAEIDASWA